MIVALPGLFSYLFWTSEWNDFSNSESLCECDASHQVSAQSDMIWEEMSFEKFRGGHL